MNFEVQREDDIARRLFEDNNTATFSHSVSKKLDAVETIDVVEMERDEKENVTNNGLGIPVLHFLKVAGTNDCRDVVRDLEKSKDHLSKLKFNFLELSSKQSFLREIGSEQSDFGANLVELEKKVVEGKANAKRNKEAVKRLTHDCSDAVAKACAGYESLQADLQKLEALRSAPLEPSAEQKKIIVRKEEQIKILQEELEQQVAIIRDLMTEKDKAELALIEAQNAPEKAQPAAVEGSATLTSFSEWYQQASTLLQNLSMITVKSVTSKSVDVDLAVDTQTGEKIHHAVVLEFDSHGALINATCSGNAFVEDIIESCILINDSQTLLREMHVRLINTAAIEREYEQLKSMGFLVEEDWSSDCPPVRIVTVKGADQNWEVCLNLSLDYPQPFAPPMFDHAKSEMTELPQNLSLEFATVTEWASHCQKLFSS